MAHRKITVENDQFRPCSWYVGIPICTNPLMVLDVVTVALVLWGGGMLFVMLGQATIGGGLTKAGAAAAFYIGMYLAGAALAAFVFVGGVLFGNRYAALYRIDAHGVYLEYMRGGIRALDRVFLPTTAFAVEPVRDPSRTVEKRIPWEAIRSLRIMEKPRVMVLRSKRGTLAKIYCPDVETLRHAEKLIRNNILQ